MRKILFIVNLILLTTTLLIFKPMHSASAQTEVVSSENERVIVKFKSLVPHFLRERTVSGLGLRLDEKLRIPNAFVLEVPQNISQKVIDTLSNKFLVDYAEKDYVAEEFDVPNDPLYVDQWGMQKIDANGAWDITESSSEVDIAIVDSGVDSNHPDLAGKVKASVDCTLSGCPSSTFFNGNDHATHVAGIAAALTNNSVGVSGVAGGADIMSVQVLGADGYGYYSWIANGIIWAVDNGAEVINLSLGGRYGSSILRDAIEYAWDNGVVVAAAAGNDGRYSYTYPAFYSDAIAVGASNQSDQKAYFSNYGSWVDIVAPGEEIISTDDGGYAYRSGTSMATPHVSGVAALVIANNPNWSNDDVRDKIENSADAISGTGYYFKNGRLNACKALDCDTAVNPTNTPTPVTDTPTPTNSPFPTATSTPETTATPTKEIAPTNTPTPSVSVTVIPTPTNTPQVTPTPTIPSTPSNTPVPTETSIPSPTPTTSTVPWWCNYVPWHYTCQ